MSVLEQDIIKKRQVIKQIESKPELDINENKRYDIKLLKSSTVYTDKTVKN